AGLWNGHRFRRKTAERVNGRRAEGDARRREPQAWDRWWPRVRGPPRAAAPCHLPWRAAERTTDSPSTPGRTCRAHTGAESPRPGRMTTPAPPARTAVLATCGGSATGPGPCPQYSKVGGARPSTPVPRPPVARPRRPLWGGFL